MYKIPSELPQTRYLRGRDIQVGHKLYLDNVVHSVVDVAVLSGSNGGDPMYLIDRSDPHCPVSHGLKLTLADGEYAAVMVHPNATLDVLV